MKKLLSLAVASAMIISLSTGVLAVEYGEEYTNMPTKTYTQKFDDVSSSHWAFAYIGEMSDREVVSGYPNGKFYPNNEVTRAEFARIMTSASGLQISAPTSKDFNDVALDAWYAPYVHAAYPYLSGYQISGNSYYMPDTPALREDIAVALVKLKGYDTLGADESLLKTMFTDIDSISSDARKYVAVAVERGLVSGYEDDTFRGQNSITRAEATAMLWRAYQYGNDNKSFDVEVSTPTPATPIPSATAEPTVATPKPTVAPTPEPIVEPTPEPTEEPEEEDEYKEKYILDTVEGSTAKYASIVTDETDLYFIKGKYYGNLDIDDYNVYKVHDGKMSTYLDLTTVMVDDMSDFRPSRLAYDAGQDRLLVEGYFHAEKNEGGLTDHEIVNKAVLDISDPDDPEITGDEQTYDYYLSNGYAVNGTGYTFDKERNVVNKGKARGRLILEKGKKFYFLNENGLQDIDGYYIRDFNEEFKKYGGEPKAIMVSNGKFLVWGANALIEVGTDGSMKVIDDKFYETYMDCQDYKGFPDVYAWAMYVADGTYYFFDDTAHCIRYIKEVD